MTIDAPISQDSGRIVIVGTGHAGVELCAALRQRGFGGDIDLLGDDPALPYQRPPLSKDYMKRPEAPLSLRGEQFYRENSVRIGTGVRVSSIDREARQVVLESGDRLSYDHLVLATGARNLLPPVQGLDTPYLLELRTLADASRISVLLPQLNRLAVIGAGFVGLEAAGLLSAMGKRVDVIDIAPRVMQRAVSPQVSAWFERFHRANGVRLHLSSCVERIETLASGVRLHLGTGTRIEADQVLLAAGVGANDELARQAGLAVDGGIIVDAGLATSDPQISAIGDCARFPRVDGPGMVRLESVQNASDQARCLAARLTGSDDTYAALPWFWSNQGEARLQIAGLALPIGNEPLTYVQRGDPAGERLSVFVYQGERLLAVETINQSGDHMVARKILGRGDTITRAQAADPATDLKALAQAARQAAAAA